MSTDKGEDWSRLLEDSPEDTSRPVHVHVHHSFEDDPQASVKSRQLSRALTCAIVSVLAVGLVGLGVRWYQLRMAQDAMKSIVDSSNASIARIQRDLAEARAKADREKAERAAIERRAIEEKNARIAAIQEEEMRRERAWTKFYVPSAFCKNPDNRATMQCANEYARAKREFAQKWAQGTL